MKMERQIKVETLLQDGEFKGFIQYDDGVISIAERFDDMDAFLLKLEEVFELNAIDEPKDEVKND